ncbi:hypothetical protein [Sphingomonas sp. ID0503]|uniref:hypothetical protein n=1 Tax=Sphingomonas sp. ID0503 TaxID=3399691 RepID=UPI003AFAF041
MRAKGILLVLVMAAGCSPEPERKPEREARPRPTQVMRAEPAKRDVVQPPPAVPAGPAAPATTERRPSPPRGLAGLSRRDIETADLPGELACGLGVEGRDVPLLIARGDVASGSAAWGAVRAGGRIVRVSAPGGFDGMIRGATFTGAGVTVRVRVTTEITTSKMESPPQPATLTFTPAGGESRTYEGSWTCGP